MESCGLRTAVLTNSGRVGSFMDSSCGRKLSKALVETPIEVPEPVAQLYCTTLFSAVLTKAGNVFWRFITILLKLYFFLIQRNFTFQ